MVPLVDGYGPVGHVGTISLSLVFQRGQRGPSGEPEVASEFFRTVSPNVLCFRAVITEEFKVPDKMVGFSKYPRVALSASCCLSLSFPSLGVSIALSGMLCTVFSGLLALRASVQAEVPLCSPTTPLLPRAPLSAVFHL